MRSVPNATMGGLSSYEHLDFWRFFVDYTHGHKKISSKVFIRKGVDVKRKTAYTTLTKKELGKLTFSFFSIMEIARTSLYPLLNFSINYVVLSLPCSCKLVIYKDMDIKRHNSVYIGFIRFISSFTSLMQFFSFRDRFPGLG